jgi:hypothetical protein
MPGLVVRTHDDLLAVLNTLVRTFPHKAATRRAGRRLCSLAEPSGQTPGRCRQSVIVLPTVLITNASGNRAAIW